MFLNYHQTRHTPINFSPKCCASKWGEMWRPANDPDYSSPESTSVERNRVIFNILRIEIWVCCKDNTGHITCNRTLNTPILDTIKWQFGLRWQCVSRPSPSPTHAHQLLTKILCRQVRRDVATSKQSRLFIPWEHVCRAKSCYFQHLPDWNMSVLQAWYWSYHMRLHAKHTDFRHNQKSV